VKPLSTLPKAHLHLHLEAAMRPSTLAELAEVAGLELPDLRTFTGFAGFIELYGVAAASLRTPGDIARLVRELAEDAAADGAVWVEVHVNPKLYEGRLGPDEAALEVVLDACRVATTATGVGVGVVLSADRTADPAVAVEQARLAVRRPGVTTFGLANDEAGHPPEPFAEAFAVAREGGLLSAPHAGELAGPASVRGALDALAPDRLGHGVRAVEDLALVRRLADEGVVCDVCPTSNLVLGLAPDLASHPLLELLAAGVAVTLNADDPLMFGASLLDEYEAVRAVGLADEAMAAIARTSITASGAPAGTKARGLAGIDAWLAT